MRRYLIIVVILFLLPHVLCSQAPSGFKYQAVVRDNAGNMIVEQSISIKIEILETSTGGNIVYTEEHSKETNKYGLINLDIGSGSTLDDFSAIQWSSTDHFLRISVDLAGGSSYEFVGTSQLLSVPYALHSGSAETFTGNVIKNLIDPVDDQDAATKAYVDSRITNPGLRIQASIDSVKCFNDSDGAIDITITGGLEPYYVEWDNGVIAEDLDGLERGKYQVYVEDENGMTTFRHFRLDTPPEILIDNSVEYVGNGSIDISVSGGVAPYSYSWSNGATTEDIDGLTEGTYTVQVTDDIGCMVSEDIIVLNDENQKLLDYLESGTAPASLQTVNSLVTAPGLSDGIVAGISYVIDIRQATDYAAGHIDGAVNIPSGDGLLTYLESTDLSGYDKVILVDYAGLTAGWLTSLVRMAGYEVSWLKYGMSSWHSDFNNWDSQLSNAYATYLNTTSNPKGPEGVLPVIETGLTTSAEILEERIRVILAEGFSTSAINASMLFDSPENYYIVCHMNQSHYDLGHVPGAIHYMPNQDLLSSFDLKTLPTDKTIALYDYSGQVGAAIVAYLRVLGYDAKVVKFGMNAMAYDFMVANGISYWSAAQIYDYPYVSSK